MYKENKNYWDNGNLHFYHNYKNGIKHGEQKCYYYDGKLYYNYRRYNGKVEGIAIE